MYFNQNTEPQEYHDPYSGKYYFIDRVPANKGHTSTEYEEWCSTADKRSASHSACSSSDAVQKKMPWFGNGKGEVSVRARKVYTGVEAYRPLFLTSALDGGEWSASHPSWFTS